MLSMAGRGESPARKSIIPHSPGKSSGRPEKAWRTAIIPQNGGKKMTVEKNGKLYEVYERKTIWSVILKSGALTVNIQVPKDICVTFEEVKEYIQKDDMF